MTWSGVVQTVIIAACLMYRSKSWGFRPRSILRHMFVIIPKNFETHFAMSTVGGKE